MVVLSRIHKASLLLLLLLRETTRRFLELLECLAICHFKCFDESLTFDNVIANRRNLSFLFLLSIYNWIILLSKINLFSLLDKSFIKILWEYRVKFGLICMVLEPVEHQRLPEGVDPLRVSQAVVYSTWQVQHQGVQIFPVLSVHNMRYSLPKLSQSLSCCWNENFHQGLQVLGVRTTWMGVRLSLRFLELGEVRTLYSRWYQLRCLYFALHN